MVSNSWQRILKALFGNDNRLHRNNKRRRKPWFSRIQLEVLEDRLAPTVGFQTLYSFTQGSDGGLPYAGVVADGSGDLYGVTYYGGTGGGGTLFKYSNGTFSVLYNFNQDSGYNPYGSMVRDSEGDLFGTTQGGGTTNSGYPSTQGTVFEYSADGKFTVLHNFTDNEGTAAQGGLIMDSKGNLFGTTYGGGGNGYSGTVFELSPNGSGGYTFNTLHAFSGSDGWNLMAGVVMDSKGNLYGTTTQGGTGYAGTVFELSPNESGAYDFSVLYNFPGGSEASQNVGGLTLDSSGNLYGTSYNGVVFKLNPTSKAFDVLYNLPPSDNLPSGSPLMDDKGNLYFTSFGNLSGASGAVFELSSNGSGGYDLNNLHLFTGSGTDGANPYAGLAVDSNGNLYGTTFTGGTDGKGTIFEITGAATIIPPVVTPSTAILPVNASTITINGTGFDTNTANDSVTFDNGVTGTVTSATATSLVVTLSGLSSLTSGTVLDASVAVDSINSGSPVQVATLAPVVTRSTSNLPVNSTSMTIQGEGFDTNATNDRVTFGNGVTGTVTAATPTSLTVRLSGLGSLTAGTALDASVTVDGVSSGNPVQVATITYSPLTTLAAFGSSSGINDPTVLAADSSGNLYGTTNTGGTNGGGTIFELVKGSNTITTLASFNGEIPGGGEGSINDVSGGLVVDSSGDLLGTTLDGGPGNYGTIFELAHGSSTITTLAAFNFTNGWAPLGGLVMDSNGDLFGTTAGGGTGNAFSVYGTVFELAKSSSGYSSTITTLATFTTNNGTNPTGSLVMDSQGDLFGTTYSGGANNLGTVFELAHGSSTITDLHDFNGNDGSAPVSGLVADSGGNLYGTASAGGAHSDGSVFEVAQGTHTFTTLASFEGINGQTTGTNGKTPTGNLVVDGRGNVFGTTSAGAAYEYGTVFEVAQGSGTITDLFTFSHDSNGAIPFGGLISSNGALFGATTQGGANGSGTVFEVTGTNQPTLNVTAGGTYNGNPFAATATAVGSDGTTPVPGTFSYAYYASSTTSGTPSSTPPTNAGTYTVVATFTSNNFNYESGETAQTTFQITPAPLTVTAIALNKPYDGTTAAYALLSDTPLGSDQVTVSYTSASFANAGPGNGITVTISGLSLSGAAADNYSLQSTTATTTANITTAGTNAYTYDAKGRIIGVVYTNGNVFERVFASDGSSTATLTNSSGTVSSGVTSIAYTYNAQGQLTSYTSYYANGNVFSRTFNSDGSSTATLKDSNGNLLADYTYNTSGQVTAYDVYYADGNVYSRTYHSDGTSAATLKSSNGTLLDDYTYNAQGQLTAYSAYYSNGNVFSRTYNSDDSSTATLKDSNGNLLADYTYNAQGRLTAYDTYTSNGNIYSRTYNSDGTSTATLKNSGGTLLLTYNYNAQGQVISVVYASSGNMLTYSYTNGVLTSASLEDSNGNLLQTYSYNSSGQISSVTYASNNNILTYTYTNGVVSSATVTNGGNTVQTYTYNTQGQIATVTYAFNSNVLTYTYTNGVLTSATLANSGGATIQTYYYNNQGQVSRIDDANGNLLETLNYNSQGQVSSIVYANGNTLTYSYTGNGSAATATLTDGSGNTLQTETFDVYGRLTQIVYANGNVYSRTYQSDGTSTATLANSSGTILDTYSYDAQGNLISVSQSQDVLFVTNGGNTISEVTASGSVSTFASGFSDPAGLAFNASGDLFVANQASGTISEVTPSGSVSTFASGFNQPVGLAFNASGDLFVTNQAGGGTIDEVTPSGSVSTFASGLIFPTWLAFNSSGDLLVSNYSGDTVSEVTPSGSVSTFAGGFNLATGLAFNAGGNLFVADYGNGTVSKVTPSGSVSTFAGGFSAPDDLAFDSSGDLFVANRAGNGVSEVTPSGSVSTLASGLSDTRGLAFGPEITSVPPPTSGQLFIANGGNTVSEVTASGSVRTYAGGFNDPAGLAFNASGDLFVANQASGTISEVTPSGQVSTFASGFNQPVGLAFNDSGDLFVANQGSGTVSEVTPLGNVSTFASGLNLPTWLAFDASGDLFVSSLNGSVYKVSPSGSVRTFASGFNTPTGLAFNSSGDLFVADYGVGTVYEVTPSGQVSTFASGFNEPSDLAFNASGDLFVANRSGNGVSEVTTSGTVSTFISGLNDTRGLAFQPETT